MHAKLMFHCSAQWFRNTSWYRMPIAELASLVSKPRSLPDSQLKCTVHAGPVPIKKSGYETAWAHCMSNCNWPRWCLFWILVACRDGICMRRFARGPAGEGADPELFHAAQCRLVALVFFFLHLPDAKSWFQPAYGRSTSSSPKGMSAPSLASTVLVLELGGRWSLEAAEFVRMLTADRIHCCIGVALGSAPCLRRSSVPLQPAFSTCLKLRATATAQVALGPCGPTLFSTPPWS